MTKPLDNLADLGAILPGQNCFPSIPSLPAQPLPSFPTGPTAIVSGASPAPLPVVIQRVLDRSVEDFSQERHRPASGKAVTHAGIALDESGSMSFHREAALEGYNAQVHVIKEGAKEAGETSVSLNIFSSSSRMALSAAPVEALKALSPGEYRPSGGSALYDAIGDLIELLLSQPAAEDPNTAFLVAAFTDGEENSSRRYSGQVLKDLITRLEATGRWTFTLMGPKGGAQEIASVLSIPIGNVAAFDPSKTESVREAFGLMASANASYMSLRSAGVTATGALYANPDNSAH